MRALSRGERQPLPGLSAPLAVDIAWRAPGLAVDVTCFGVDAAGRLSDDRYMVFYNQRASPEGALRLENQSGSAARFIVALDRLPDTVHKLVFAAAIDGDGTMARLEAGVALFAGELKFEFAGFDREKAVIVAELCRYGGAWRVNAVGQGFSGGLSALLAHFGGEEIRSLDQRIELAAPHLVPLTKKAAVSLEKSGLAGHRARCVLCLDISSSMRALYAGGQVQALADRVMALATRLDDDGELDVFLFGDRGHRPKPMRLDGCSEYIRELLEDHGLEPGTRYHTAMKLVREHCFGGSERRASPLEQPLPVYVMFVTDGGTSNRASAENQVRWSSQEPIFWQFMAIGSPKDSNFEFLERLDELDGRLLDNAGFFSIDDPAGLSDDELYARMMREYPAWVAGARALGLLAGAPT